jgi:hypothetical protein
VIFVVTLIGAIWMHVTVVSVLHQASPELANKFEHEHAYEQGDRTLDQREMTGV